MYSCAKKNRVIFFVTLIFFLMNTTSAVADGFNISQWEIGFDAENFIDSESSDQTKGDIYQQKHQYLSYPSFSIFYDTERERYFYNVDGTGVTEALLPHNLLIEPGDHISLEMNKSIPPLSDEKNIKNNSPKYKKRKFFGDSKLSKIIFILLYENNEK